MRVKAPTIRARSLGGPASDWEIQTAFTRRYVREDGRALMIMVQRVDVADEPWMLMGIESVAATHRPEQVLDDHAHKLVGRYTSLPDAFREGESFARSWARKKTSIADACACGEIEETRRIERPRRSA